MKNSLLLGQISYWYKRKHIQPHSKLHSIAATRKKNKISSANYVDPIKKHKYNTYYIITKEM